MKRMVHAIVLVVLTMALVVPGIAGANGTRFFIGLWQGVDTLDGSEILVSISDNNRDGILEVRYTETFFTTCIAQDKGFNGSPGLVEGVGTIEAKTLTWTFSFKCYDPATNSLAEIETGTATFEANRRNNILVDASGNILHRVGRR